MSRRASGAGSPLCLIEQWKFLLRQAERADGPAAECKE